MLERVFLLPCSGHPISSYRAECINVSGFFLSHIIIEMKFVAKSLDSSVVLRLCICIKRFRRLKRFRRGQRGNFQASLSIILDRRRGRGGLMGAKLDSWSLPTERQRPSHQLQLLVIELLATKEGEGVLPVILLSWPETEAPPISAFETVIKPSSLMPSCH